jgi:putative transposase
MVGPTRIRAYRFRIYPTRRQRLALEAQLRFACDLYNAGLEQRRYARRAGKRVGYVSQCRELTALRAAGDGPPQMSCSAMRSPLRRLERAYQAFFRRVKAGEKPGYPRFRSQRRYDSLTWDSAWSIQEKRLALPGIGHLKVNWHRELPESAKVCTVTVRRVVGRWYACFALTLPAPVVLPRTSVRVVGLDLGIQNFAALSTGELIPGPRAYRAAQRKLRVAQRRVSRRMTGSGRRQKACLLLARLHERIRNIRGSHAHQLSRQLVSDFVFIAVEDLQIRRLARGFLAKDVSDQGWAEFLRLLRYKAEDAGIQVVAVPPGGSSQTCSRCEARVPKPISERVHRCPGCALVIDRDVNAARNLLRLGLSRQALTWPSGACVA